MTDVTQADIDAAEAHFAVWYPDTAWGFDPLAETLARHRQHAYDQGYYDGCANPIVRYDALRAALVDLLHAVCGKTGFAEAVRRDSGRIYPWPALDLAEAKARAALEQSK